MKFIAEIRKESEFNTKETNILNLAYSLVKSKGKFYLEFVIESVHEKNKDIVIDALQSLIQKKVIIPKTN